LADLIEGRDAISRRRFMQQAGAGAGLLAAAPLLAACGDDSDGGASDSGTVGGVLNLYVWEGYDGPDPTAAWRKKNGVAVKAGYIGSQDDVTTRLKTPAGAGTEVSYVVQWYVDYYKQLGLMSPITVDEVPALGDLYPEFDQAPFKNDDGTFNSVPHNFGWNGFAYSPERLPFEEPIGWDVLFDRRLKGRLAVWDEPIAQIQFAAYINGFDPDRLTHEELDEVKEWLARLRPQVKTFPASGGDYFSQFASGDVDAIYPAWNATPQFVEGAKVECIIPREGAVGWVDAAFIPPDADNRATALAWCQLLLQGKAAAEIYDSFAGGATTPQVVPLLDATTRGLFPYDDLASLFSQLWRPRGFPRGDSEYVTADEAVATWQEFKAS
jgi:spermidine/putrescine-binding protein